MPLFHLAFPIHNIWEAKVFYIDGLGCSLGRETDNAVIFGLYGHQLVAYVAPDYLEQQHGIYPRHFGVIFQTLAEWETLLKRARDRQLRFFRTECIRFRDTTTEHHSFFLRDPSGNLLEFKYYKNPLAILETIKGETSIGEKNA